MKKKLIKIITTLLFITIVLISYIFIKNITNTNIEEVEAPSLIEIPTVIDTTNIINYNELINNINNYIDRNNLGDNVAIYVNELDTNNYYAYNETNNYIAASIYKLPLAMAYYDLINTNEISADDLLEYKPSQYEPGGPIANEQLNTFFDIDILLEYMIQYSDNSAAHILYDNLGGWLEYKKIITKYSNNPLDSNFINTYDNVFTAEYMNDVLYYLYTNSNSYEDLLYDMINHSEYRYLSDYPNINIAQKWGNFEYNINSVGLIESDNEFIYSIVIFTTNLNNANEHIININELCLEYYELI